MTRDVPYGMKVIEGRIDQVEDFMFNIDQVIIECKAISHDDIIVKKKHLNLRRKSPPPPPPPYQPSPPQVISSPADDFVDEANLNSRHSPSSSSLQTDHVYDPEVVSRSVCDNIRYTFSSNHNIYKSSCGLCFWASDPLIERFY